MEEKLYWIWLSKIEGLGSKKLQILLQKYKTPKCIWNKSKEELMTNENIGEKTVNEILNPSLRIGLQEEQKNMKKLNIDIITINDKQYPKKLKNIYDPPIILYYKGNKQILNEFAIGVIGCRNCTKYGEMVAKKISYSLSKKNVNIISGLARGIDTFSHIGTLKAKGKTIAVVGNGLDNIYPYENKKIAEEIVNKNGLILSEYPIGTKPNRNNFPARNRIISALSDGIVVVEAKQKSGTLITVDFALEQGKNVYVVPGNIDSENSKGTNDLIKQGAKLITCLDDILEDFTFFENVLKMEKNSDKM